MRRSSAAAPAAAAELSSPSPRARRKIPPRLTWVLRLICVAAGWRATAAAAAAAVVAEAAVAATCFGPLGLCGVSSPCEPGHYCTNGVKFPCPEGRFGFSSSESSFLCSDSCPAGFFCPAGSSSPTSCGNSTVYCPAGSAAPSVVSSGNYTLGGTSPAGRTAEAMCPKGRYCQQGMAVFCPPGTYGNTGSLQDAACSGPCPPGWYCPPGTIDPYSFACGGPEHYCPEGSGRRLPVDMGFYAGGIGIERGKRGGGYSLQTRCPIGQYCVGGVSYACPPGRFGASQLSTNSSCTGPCREGYFCPPGSYRANQHACQNASVFCPEGSAVPTEVSDGFYTVHGGSEDAGRHPSMGFAAMRTGQVRCEPGFYCAEGVRRACPPGFYGNVSGLSTPYCSGPCAAGHICGLGSTTPTEEVCGGDAATFCPEGSSAPSKVREGYYTLVTTTEGDLRNDTHIITTLTAEALCEPGYWCEGGVRHLCEAGSFGNEFGLTRPNCSGPCNPGFLCGGGSVSPEERPCGDPSVYCPGGDWEPTPISSGYYSVGGAGTNTRTGQVLSPPGSFANDGVLFICPPGRYGASHGLASPLCSGECSPGFYCPAGSISPRERACGSASLFCPAGSGWPIVVDEGHYTTDYSTVPDEEACPPGYFRNTSYPYDTDPTKGEPSAIVTAVPLFPCHICPDGTFKANTGDSLALCLPCDEVTAESIDARTSCVCRRIGGGDVSAEILYFNTTSATCQNVTGNFRPTAEVTLVESAFTRYAQKECEPGHFCVKGARFPCPAGRFGSTARETRPGCEGECAGGWYCPEASVSAHQVPCGSANVFCPSGSSSPIFVNAGSYTTGDFGVADGYHGSETAASGFANSSDHQAASGRPDDTRGAAFRSRVSLCPVGWYCTGDGGGSECPPGLYGSERGLSDPACSGVCAAGHSCPSGSTSPFQRKCGGVGVYCPTGSSAPSQVLVGYYGVHAGPQADLKAARDPFNETHSAQVLCEPGYFCKGGRKEPCPAGTFLWQYGESSRDSCAPCKAGYYCPGKATSPSLVATLLECGSSALFCPLGSIQPRTVGTGYYSMGGGLDGTTRDSQVRCEPGHYCKEGMQVMCPAGTYGASAGLYDQGCSGFCPPGAACPEGTIDPIACEEGFYAIGGAVACSKCPGKRAAGAVGERCRTSRSCCT